MRRTTAYILLLIFIGLAYATALHPGQRKPAAEVIETSETTAMPDSLASAASTAAADSADFDDESDEEFLRRIGVLPPDSLAADSLRTDSLANDSLANDSTKKDRNLLTRINREKVDIEAAVAFSASDSLLMIGTNNAFLFGNATVEYTDLKLNAAEIRMDMDSTTVFALGVTDSLGNVTETPVFKDKSGEYESKTMRYNFKTQKGYITDVITEQGEGYLTGGVAKKLADGSFNIQQGRYTTCDQHDHPHFYFQITKGKMRPKKDIVVGPIYMVLCDVPLPVALPFGYFPFTKDYSSGIIFPTFGEDYNRGFYVRDGGYYFAINNNIDLAVRGELYSKGSWGLSGRSSYTKRYKFRGSFDISYITTILGDKGAPDYSKQNNFRVVWNHSQDAKANPNMSFSAAVNFATSGYTRNDLNSYYNNSFTENTKSSTVNWSYRFPGTKWSISATANISQRTQDSTLAVSFPNLNVTMSQLQPFKRKHAVGAEKWYEKIRMSYSGQFQNSLTAKQNEFFQKNLIKDWRNAMKHSLPISATFSVLKYLNISPSVSLNDRMYSSKIRRQWDPDASREIADTIYGFYNVFDFNAALSFDTKLYGFYKPMKFLGDKVQMVRHVLTPTVSFSASPDFSSPFWGYYGSYSYIDPNGLNRTTEYNYFSHGLYGSPSRGKTGMVSVNLSNNLEMKVKSDADTTGYKKISLIENFAISQSYNFAADSMRWSNINTSILLRLTRNFNLNLSATWDPYTYALSPSGYPVRVDRPRWTCGKGWARLSSTGTSFSYTFNNDTFKRKKDSSKKDESKEEADDFSGEGQWDDEDTGQESFADAAKRRRGNNHDDTGSESDSDGYAKWEFPWNLSINYSINYGYGLFDKEKMEYAGKWTQNLSFSGSIRPTKNWNFSFSASYNFDLKKIAYMNCNISRDLHCFTMSASFVPVGPYKSYNFHIAVKSSLLSDLKYDQRSSTRYNLRWY